ncbi:MAG: type II toxin-antitoxin system prevent-host-death family antitoxin [Solirubrobacterales bacterium]
MATQTKKRVSVGVRELHNRTSALMQMVEDGAEIEITKHGKVLGVLRPSVPDAFYERLKSEGRIREARVRDDWVPEPIALPPGVTISDLIDEQRR